MEDSIDLIDIKKICSTCKLEKSLINFSKKGTGKWKYGRNSVCKNCVKTYEHNRVMLDPEKKKRKYAQSTVYRRKNPNKYKGVIFPSKWKRLEIIFTKEMYYEFLEKQKGVCAICQGVETIKGKQIALSVDHDHITKKVRGLLCGNCNRGIGLLQDNHEIVEKASQYLKNSK